MQALIRIIIIILAILLIRLLRRWIKRLIFIAILLVLAFFIYWIFNPSWAGKLWYNFRTFPQRITSWVSNQSFTDYENYKLKSSKIWDIIKSASDDTETTNNPDEEEIIEPENNDDKIENNANDEETNSNKTIKSFQTFSKISKMPKLINKSDSNWAITWYTKSDVLWIINTYIEEHLDDYTDILVTVEYEENQNDPQKITLETKPKI